MTLTPVPTIPVQPHSFSSSSWSHEVSSLPEIQPLLWVLETNGDFSFSVFPFASPGPTVLLSPQSTKYREEAGEVLTGAAVSLGLLDCTEMLRRRLYQSHGPPQLLLCFSLSDRVFAKNWDIWSN